MFPTIAMFFAWLMWKTAGIEAARNTVLSVRKSRKRYYKIQHIVGYFLFHGDRSG